MGSMEGVAAVPIPGMSWLTTPGTWTGLTVVTGSITPTFEMEMSKDNSFVDGSTVPYGVDFWANLYEPSLITAARLQSPTGKWYGFGVDSADIGQQKKWSPNIPDGSAAAFPDGTYTVEVTWAGGTYSSSFAMADKVVMPTQIPRFLPVRRKARQTRPRI